MEPINIKLPHYKQAHILQENFKEFGIKCVYIDASRCVYITILAAPSVHKTDTGVYMTLTRKYTRFTEVRDNFDEVIKEYKAKYKEVYANNPEMLKYLETIK